MPMKKKHSAKKTKKASAKPAATRVSQGALAQRDLKSVRELAKLLGLGKKQLTAKQRAAQLSVLGISDAEIEAAAAAYDSFGGRIGAKIDTNGARTMIARGKAYKAVIIALDLLPQQAREMLTGERVPVAQQVHVAYKTMEGLMSNSANADMHDAWQAMAKARQARLAVGVKTREVNKAAKEKAAANNNSTTTTTKTETTTQTNGGKSQ
jgi:hypothetical protein